MNEWSFATTLPPAARLICGVLPTWVGVVVAAAVLVAIPLAIPLASASPLAGLGSFLGVGPRSTQAPPEDSNSNGGGGFGFPNPLQFPQKVLNTFSGGKQGQESQDGQDAAAPAPAQDHQHHPHRVAPPKAAASTAAPARQPPPTTAAATTASTTTAAPTTAAPTAAKEVTTVVSRFASSDSPPSEQPAKSSGGGGLGNYTEEEIEKCREKWLEVTNSTISDNLDILSVLLENGGFPGQLDGNLKWERNATEGRPNRWTYFWGDSDYKTYIRVENGEVDRRAPPVQGTNPSALSGDIYWSPPDFCGKLRHAKYTQAQALDQLPQPWQQQQPDALGKITVEVKAELCSIGNSTKGRVLRCSDFLADRAPLSAALIASLAQLAQPWSETVTEPRRRFRIVPGPAVFCSIVWDSKQGGETLRCADFSGNKGPISAALIASLVG